MSERAFLFDNAVVLAASFPALFLCKRLSLPSIVGYLVTGVAIGPHALGLLRTAGRVEEIAELGVVLILFFVGLEFPFAKLKTLGRTALFGGVFQLSLTTLAVAALARLFGDPIGVAVFKGALLSLSSTAVLIPILASRDELAAPFARRFFAVSLFQALAVIPFVLFLPMLAPKGAATPSTERVLLGVGIAL